MNRIRLRLFIIIMVLAVFGVNLRAVQLPSLPTPLDFDLRGNVAVAVMAAAVDAQTQSETLLRARIQGARVEEKEEGAGQVFVTCRDGFLTGPGGEGLAIPATRARQFAAQEPNRAVAAFLDEYAPLFGHDAQMLATARVKREFVGSHNGLRTVVWEQQLDGLPVFEATLVAHTTRQGELVNVCSRFLGDLAAAAEVGTPNHAAALVAPGVSVVQAIITAAAGLDLKLDARQCVSDGLDAGVEKRQRFRVTGLLGETEAALTWLPMNRTDLRLCWDVTLTVPARGEMFRILVDAQTGQALLRRCLTAYLSDASYRVFTSDSPSPFSPGHSTALTNQPPLLSRQLLTLTALSTNASPAGWITDGENTTLGNNVDAHLDKDNNNVPDPGSRPTGSPFRIFDFPMNLTQAPVTYTNATVVQLFYLNNWMHDKLYDLGFTEAAGNFQTANFGRGGLGNDAVQADAQDGSGTDNANFSTPPDGSAPRMQMYIFTGSSPDRDGDLDAEIVLHEYTHGLSNRRVGGGIGLSALQSRGTGEGWSDFYALALLSETNDEPTACYASGGYATYKMSGLTQNYYYGIRRYPYSTDMAKNPLTFKDIDPDQASSHPGIPRSPIIGNTANEVHNMGEVWCVALWEARANLIAKYGPAAGNQLMLQLVTDGMNLSPANPTFLQARDAIIQADLVDNEGANRSELGAAFAKRGMGVGSTSPASSKTVGLVESYDIEDALQVTPALGISASGTVGGPFSPLSQTYSVINVGTGVCDWTVNVSADWINPSATHGALDPGTSALVELAFNENANSLSVGTYSATIAFSNCADGVCLKRVVSLTVSPPRISFFSLDTDPGWSRQGQWAFGKPAGLGGAAHGYPDPASGVTGTNVFGVNLNGDCTTNVAGPYYVTAGPFNFRGEVGMLLRFSRWLNSDFQPYAYATIEGSTNGVGWTKIWDNGASEITDKAWQTLTYDISDLADNGTNVFVRWGYQIKSGAWFYSGWNIDDIEFLGLRESRLTLSVPERGSEGDGVLLGAGQITVSEPSTNDLSVALISNDPTEVMVTNVVTIPAGQTNASFALTIVDDLELDGTQWTTLTATAVEFGDASDAIAVSDNETTTLRVVLPATTIEDAGTVPCQISISSPVATSVSVGLMSSDNTEIKVPNAVTLLSGQTSAVFTVSAVDDSQIDGPQVAWVTAHVQNWTDGSNTISVLDNENTNLMLVLPSSGYEGQVITNGGQVSISGTLTTNLEVTLQSSDITELQVPSPVTILAGQTVATFDVILPPDGLMDGVQNVGLTASVAGFVTAVGAVEVRDRDIHHIGLSTIASPQMAGTPFNVTLSVQDINGATITVYQATATLTGAGDSGPVTMTPTNVLLANGVWIGSLRVNTPDASVRLTVSDGQGNIVLSNPFDVQVGPLDHFVWSSIASPQRVDEPFPVTVTARDVANNTVTGFVGTAALRGLQETGVAGSRLMISECSSDTPDFIEIQNVSGQFVDCSGWGVAVSESYSDINAVNTTVWTLGSTMSPGQVFYRTDSTSDNYWGSNILWNPGNNGWAMIVDGVGQVVDFVAWGWTKEQIAAMSPVFQGRTISIGSQFTTDGVNASGTGSIQRQGNQDHNTSDDFPWILPRSKGSQNAGLTVPFSGGEIPVSIIPTNIGNFVEGIWNGLVTVLEPASNMFVRADDGNGHSGTSGAFTAQALSNMDVDLSDSQSTGEVGKPLTLWVNVHNYGPSRAFNVRVIDTLPESVSFVSANVSQGTISNAGGTVVWNAGGMSDFYAWAKIVVVPTLGGGLTNTVALTADVTDPEISNNSDSKVTTVKGCGVLAVTPGMDLSARGFAGGPFSPSSQIYTLTNSGTDTLTWQADAQSGWISLSPTGGTLPPRASRAVTVAIDAAGLPSGTYADTVAFTNLTTGIGSTTRDVDLTVMSGSLLQTIFASDNGYAGNMFDIVPKKNLGISAFDVNVSPSGQVTTVAVYYRRGSSFGHEDSNAGWSLLGSRVVTAAGQDSPTFVDLSGNGMEFLRGQTYGLYVHVDYGSGVTLQYTKGSGTYENAALALMSNCGKGDPPFTGETYPSRIWNGSIYYDTGLVDALGVSPAEGLSSQGQEDGSFTPSNKVYTLTNRGESNVIWTAGCASNWVSIVPAGGELLAGASDSVTVAISAASNALSVGTYNATVTVSNTAIGAVKTREVVLKVWNKNLMVTLPPSGHEGQVFTNGGRVAIGYARANALTVRLSASHTNKIHVLPQVVIAAGQTNAAFVIAVIDNNNVDGSQAVTVTAEADGFAPGAAVITVEDNDVPEHEIIVPVFDLSTDPGWSCEGQWQFGKPMGQGGAVFGNPDPLGGFTGTNVFGVNLNGDYATAVGGPYYLTVGPLDFTNYREVSVQFRRWLNSDLEPYVRVAVEVSTNGTAWSAVWSNGQLGCYESAWNLVEYPLPAADRASRVFVRWSYQTGPEAFAASGWNLDDIVFMGIPVPALRTSHGTPFAWLQRYGLTNLEWEATDILDTDGDGKAAWEEYISDTVPTNRDSVLALLGVTFGTGGVDVQWKGGIAATQYLERKDHLSPTGVPWIVVLTNAPPTSLTNSVMDVTGTNAVRFYRVRVVR